MGRLDKLKRQAILEANQRVLGIIKEDKVEDLLGIQDDIDDGVRELENVWNLDDAANQIDHYKEDHDEEENENLDDAMWKLDAAQSAIRDAITKQKLAVYQFEQNRAKAALVPRKHVD